MYELVELDVTSYFFNYRARRPDSGEIIWGVALLLTAADTADIRAAADTFLLVEFVAAVKNILKTNDSMIKNLLQPFDQIDDAVN